MCARLHHVFWPLILAANIATMVSFVISCLLALVGIIGAMLSLLGVATGLWKLTALAVIPALYCVGLHLSLVVGDRLVRRAVAAPPPSWGPKVITAGAIAAASSSYAMFAAPFARSLTWRSLTYDIAGRDRIRLRAYRPYQAAGTAPSRSIM
jgi:hypothetical protein